MSWPNTCTWPADLFTSEAMMPIAWSCRAVGPEQRKEIALLDVEVDALERLHAVAVGLRQLAQRQGFHAAWAGVAGSAG